MPTWVDPWGRWSVVRKPTFALYVGNDLQTHCSGKKLFEKDLGGGGTIGEWRGGGTAQVVGSWPDKGNRNGAPVQDKGNMHVKKKRPQS